MTIKHVTEYSNILPQKKIKEIQIKATMKHHLYHQQIFLMCIIFTLVRRAKNERALSPNPPEGHINSKRCSETKHGTQRTLKLSIFSIYSLSSQKCNPLPKYMRNSIKIQRHKDVFQVFPNKYSTTGLYFQPRQYLHSNMYAKRWIGRVSKT